MSDQYRWTHLRWNGLDDGAYKAALRQCVEFLLDAAPGAPPENDLYGLALGRRWKLSGKAEQPNELD